QPLFDAHVLDTVEGDGAVLARQYAAFDHNLVRADEKAEARPCDPSRDERDQQEGAECREHINPLPCNTDRCERWEEIERARAEPGARERARRGMQSLPLRALGRGVVRKSGDAPCHAKSVWMWRRISSRIAAARSARRPGNVTVLLCVPEVWTTRCDRP